MSTFKLLSTLVAGALIFFSCSENKNSDKNAEAIPGMIEYDLSSYGKPFAIWLPDTSAAVFSITEEPDGALQIKSGKNFGINIYEQESDLSLKRDDLKYDEVNKFSAFIKEDENGLLWESAITVPEYHFVYNKRFQGADYSFSDIPGNNYSREGVEEMYVSAVRSIEK